MPTIIRPQPAVVGKSKDIAENGQDFFRRLSPQYEEWDMRQTSVTNTDVGTIVPFKSGFVSTVLQAWQQHLHLELRPDDVWLAVLVQFSFFVNGAGRAEALRSHFVAHEGQRRLIVDCRAFGSIEEVDMAFLTDRLVGLARKYLVDPELADWLLPNFSTTLPHDRSTAAAAFLGTMKQYFHYGADIACGFPSITLQGERSDWADLARRVTRLSEFDTATDDQDGASVSQWSHALALVINFMVESFDRPEADDIRDFWMRACHSAGPIMSGGVVTMSGWLTAFCWWRADGSRQKAYDDAELAGMWHEDWRRLQLRGIGFPVINHGEVPSGITTVPITFYYDGNSEAQSKTETVLLAGSTGMKIMDGEGTRVQPFSSWWLLRKLFGHVAPKSPTLFGRRCFKQYDTRSHHPFHSYRSQLKRLYLTLQGSTNSSIFVMAEDLNPDAPRESYFRQTLGGTTWHPISQEPMTEKPAKSLKVEECRRWGLHAGN
ncbi:hypothetical protein EsH8_VI_000099 [Colletotrichum jinshuiense]